jgi:hypothetical protein
MLSIKKNYFFLNFSKDLSNFSKFKFNIFQKLKIGGSLGKHLEYKFPSIFDYVSLLSKKNLIIIFFKISLDNQLFSNFLELKHRK